MADVKIDTMTNEQIDDLGSEELNRVEFDEETGDAILKSEEKKEVKEEAKETPKVDEKAKGDETKKTEEEPKEEKKEEAPETKLDKQISDIESIPKEKQTDVQKVELRRLNAEKRMHQATQEAATIRRERDDLAKKLYEKEESDQEPFEQLTDEEKNDLKDSDPDEYNDYVKEEQKYVERETAKVRTQAQNTFTNIAAFYKALNGKKEPVDDLLKLEVLPDGAQRLANAEFRQFLASEDFKKVDTEVSGYKKQYDGTYSVDQMMKAHFIVNKDKILSDAQLTGREQALQDIGRASHSDASKLDRIPKTDSTKGFKKVSELSDQDIENMSAEESKSYVEQMEREGMA